MQITERYARALRAIHPRLGLTVRGHSSDPSKPVVWATYHLAEGMDLRLAALSEFAEFPAGPEGWLASALKQIGWEGMVANAKASYGASTHPSVRLGLDRATNLPPRT